MADDGVIHIHRFHSGHGTVGSESAEVAAHSGVHPVDALAAYLHRASLAPGGHSAQQVGLRQVLHKLHFLGIILFKLFLGILYNAATPILDGSNPVHTAQSCRNIKAFQIQENMFHIVTSQRRIA